MPSYFSSTEFSIPLRQGFTGAYVHEVGVGDFNGDAKADVILAYFLYPLEDRGVPIRFLSGNGLGDFTDSTATLGGSIPTSVHAREIVIGDFNRDGRADVFIADHGYDTNPFPGAQNSLLFSTGATGLTNKTAQLPQVSDYSHSAKAADIDGDGDLDIFVGNGGGGQAWVRPFFLKNDGSGGFSRTTEGLPASVAQGFLNHWSEAFLDVDRDGDLDLFLGSSTNAGSALLLNNGGGIFTVSDRTLPRGQSTADAVDISVMDINRDGWSDLIISYSVPAGSDILRQLQVLMNDRSGGFVDATTETLPSALLSGPWITRIQPADVNGDGLQDLVLFNGSATPVYLNDGAGRFVAMPGLVPSNIYDKVTPGDFNGDGRTDFFVWRGVWNGAENLRIDLGLAPQASQTGGAGVDGMMGGMGAETFFAGAGDDVVVSGGGADCVNGEAGNDLIATGDGSDTAWGGDGADTIQEASGSNLLRGEAGDDSLSGGSGFDDMHGNMGNDTLRGNDGEDWVVGGKDNDLLFGDAAFDIVYGNMGNDTVDGGAGNDWVRGGQGDDTVMGGTGDDWIWGDRGNDTISGGAGADLFHATSGAGIDRITDFSYAEGDRLKLEGGPSRTVAQVGADVVVDMGNGDQVILVGVSLSSLGEGWIL
jgi:hypothetical protein